MRPHLHSGPLNIGIITDDFDILKRSSHSEAHLGVRESVTAVTDALKKQGHRVRHIRLRGDLLATVRRMNHRRPHAVFHLAETFQGDTGGELRIAGLLDAMGILHTSAPLTSLSLCRDKVRAKSVLRAAGIPTPNYAVSTDGGLPVHLPRGPWVTKPSLEDGSIGIDDREAVVHAVRHLRERVKKLHRKFRQPILIERYVPGREFNVGSVAGIILPPAEIDFSGLPEGCPPIVGYKSKWESGSVYFKGSWSVCPAPVSARLRTCLQNTGRRALDAAGVSGYARVDMRMDHRGRIFVIDVNPNPDLAPSAGLAKMARAAGWTYSVLIQKILEFSLHSRSNHR